MPGINTTIHSLTITRFFKQSPILIPANRLSISSYSIFSTKISNSISPFLKSYSPIYVQIKDSSFVRFLNSPIAIDKEEYIYSGFDFTDVHMTIQEKDSTFTFQDSQNSQTKFVSRQEDKKPAILQSLGNSSFSFVHCLFQDNKLTLESAYATVYIISSNTISFQQCSFIDNLRVSTSLSDSARSLYIGSANNLLITNCNNFEDSETTKNANISSVYVAKCPNVNVDSATFLRSGAFTIINGNIASFLNVTFTNCITYQTGGSIKFIGQDYKSQLTFDNVIISGSYCGDNFYGTAIYAEKTGVNFYSTSILHYYTKNTVIHIQNQESANMPFISVKTLVFDYMVPLETIPTSVNYFRNNAGLMYFRNMLSNASSINPDIIRTDFVVESLETSALSYRFNMTINGEKFRFELIVHNGAHLLEAYPLSLEPENRKTKKPLEQKQKSKMSFVQYIKERISNSLDSLKSIDIEKVPYLKKLFKPLKNIFGY